MAGNTFDDKTLIELVLAGDEEAKALAATQLITRCQPTMLRIVRAVLGESHSEVLDVVQNALMKLLAALAQFDFQSSITTYACRIAINEALAYIRKESRRKDVGLEDQQLSVSSFDTLDALIEKEKLGNVKDAIQALPPQTRKVFELRFFDGLSPSEVRKSLDMSAATFRVHMFRGRRRLREMTVGLIRIPARQTRERTSQVT